MMLCRALPLVCAAFCSMAFAGVIFTEFMYHPPNGRDDLEYIEIFNDAPEPVDLSGWAFTRGIHFVFPSGTALPGFGYLVIAADESAVRREYGITNVIGNFSGKLDNAGEMVELRDELNGLVEAVEYDDQGRWPVACDGTGHSLSLRDLFGDPSRGESWAPSGVLGGTPGAQNFDETSLALVTVGEQARFFRGRTEPSSPVSAWREVTFQDAAWELGASGFGYDTQDTFLQYGTTLDDMKDTYLTLFVRHSFQLPAVGNFLWLRLEVDYDDGFVAYLNGQEVARRNVGSTAHSAPATAFKEPGAYEVFSLSTALLRSGTNVLALQGHNYNLGSSDFALVARLIGATRGLSPPPDYLVLNEIITDASGSTWVEVFNRAPDPAQLIAFSLSTNPDQLQQQMINKSVLVPPRGFAMLPFLSGPNDSRLILTNPGGQQVWDAIRYVRPAPGKSYGRYPDGGNRWYANAVPSATAPNQLPVTTDVVINEIMYRPFSDLQSEEYIELFNRGPAPVNLAGWTFSEGVAYTFPQGSVLAPGEYKVIAKDPARISTLYGLAGVSGPYVGSLDNDGERLVLRDAAGNVADEVRYYDDRIWVSTPDGGGPSLELADPREENDAPPAWFSSDETQRTSWETYTITGVYEQGESELHLFLINDGIVRIDNIRVLSATGVNHLPNGDFETGTAGWTISGNHAYSYRLNGDASSGTSCLRLIAAGRGVPDDNKLEIDLSPPLVSGATYTIAFDARWEVGCNLVSFRTHSGSIAGTIRLPVPPDLGTPGRRNSRSTPNIGPIITDTRHDPVTPRSDQWVSVTARVSDVDGVQAVNLWFQADWHATPSRLVMRDDGVTGGDWVAGDRIYTALIPPLRNNSLVEFYIEAIDTRGAVNYWPESGSYIPALYRVDNQPPVGYGRFYDLILAPRFFALLGNPRLSDLLVYGTLTVDGKRAFYGAGVRTRGTAYSRPNGYRVQLPVTDPLHRTTVLNLDGLKGDLTYQQERMTHRLMRYFGVPTTRKEYVRVRVNNGSTVVCDRVERLDKDFLRAYYPNDADQSLYDVDEDLVFADDGSFYGITPTLTYRGEDKEKYRWFFRLRTNEQRDDFEPIIRLAEFMDPAVTSNEVFDAQVEQRLVLDMWLKVLAVRATVGGFDSYGFWTGKNLFLYPRGSDGRWLFLPWDDDQTFVEAGLRVNLFNPNFPDIYRLLTRPAIQRRYLTYIQELLSGPFSTDVLNPWLNANYAVLGSDGAQKPDSIRDFIMRRKADLAPIVIGADPPFAIITNGGQPFRTDQPSVVLEGTAPWRVRTLRRNNLEVNTTFTSAERWMLTVPLVQGVNTVRLSGHDRSGALVAEASISIEYDPLLSVGLPILTGFEPDEAPPFEIGALPQHRWVGAGEIQDTTVASGTQALLLTGPVSRILDATPATALWIDYRLRTAGEVFPVTPDAVSGPVGLVFSATEGVLVLDGDGQGRGTWLVAAPVIDPATFVRVTLDLDYAAQRWDFYLGSLLRAEGLGFARTTLHPLTCDWVFGATAIVDDVYLGLTRPSGLGVPQEQLGLY